MKKLMIACGVVAMTMFATSCKKDYTCTCTTKVEGSDDIVTSAEIKDSKKKDAEDACDKLDAVSTSTSCTLD